MAQRITVKTPDGAYPIHIGTGILSEMIAQPEQFGMQGRCVVITNPTLQPLYGNALVSALPNAALVVMPDGESFKTLETVAQLYADLVTAGADRATTIIALGGGVIGDTAGFAASTYMRGVKLIQIPTSLLAMVDSSVGGKVGVDLPQGKNLVGAFKQPEQVMIDPRVLKTLDHRQWACGMAEVIKHGLLADEKLLDPALWTLEYAEDLITQAVQVKVDVVQADPYEQNVRAHLNLGHTFAHAIERVTNYAWLHGEAVGVGLVAAARLSNRLGLCDDELATRVEKTVALADLPTRIGDLDPDALFAAMHTDKKWAAGKSRFVLLKGMNHPTIVDNVAAQDVLAVLKSLNT